MVRVAWRLRHSSCCFERPKLKLNTFLQYKLIELWATSLLFECSLLSFSEWAAICNALGSCAVCEQRLLVVQKEMANIFLVGAWKWLMVSKRRQRDIRGERGHWIVHVHADQAGSATDDAGGVLEGCRGESKSRVGAAAWKLVLPNIFYYNISLAFNFARLYPFSFFSCFMFAGFDGVGGGRGWWWCCELVRCPKGASQSQEPPYAWKYHLLFSQLWNSSRQFSHHLFIPCTRLEGEHSMPL